MKKKGKALKKASLTVTNTLEESKKGSAHRRNLKYDTKNKFGSHTVSKFGAALAGVSSIAVGSKLLPAALHDGHPANVLPATIPLIVAVIPPVSKWISQHLINRDVYSKLDSIAHSSGLVDYDSIAEKGPGPLGSEPVVAGVLFKYKEMQDGSISIKVYPRGIKNSDKCGKLIAPFQNAFNSAVYSVEEDYDHFTYTIADVTKQRFPVRNSMFRPFSMAQHKPTIMIDRKTGFKLKGSGGILLTGRTGSGKTNLATYLMLAVCKQLKADLYIIDPKRADLYALKDYLKDGDKHVASESNQIARMLRELNQEMDRRYEQMGNSHNSNTPWGADYTYYGFKPNLLVVDEVAAMLNDGMTAKEKKEIISGLQQLALKGRQAGFFTLIIAQRLSAETMSRDITLQFGTRIVMGRADNESYRMAFPMTESVVDLPKVPTGAGYGLIYVDGQSSIRPTPIAAPDMSNIDVAHAIERISQA